MLFARNEQIHGFPAVLVLNAARTLRQRDLPPVPNANTFRDLAAVLKTSSEDAQRLVAVFQAQGWLEPDLEEFKDGRLCLSDEGFRLAASRIGNPLPRVKAEALLAKAESLAQAINRDDRLPMYVEKLAVFGSFLTDKPALGDLDLAWRQKRRTTEHSLAIRDRLKQGRVDYPELPGSWFDGWDPYRWEYSYVFRQLKQRSQYVSLHEFDELETLNCPFQLVLEATTLDVPPYRYLKAY